MVKIPCFQNKGHGFDPWLGNQDSTCCEAEGKKKKTFSDEEKLREFIGKDSL